MRIFARVTLCALLTSAALLYSACGNNGSTKTQLRALQASPNSTPLDILVAGTPVFNNLVLGPPTNYMSVLSGSQNLEIEASGSSTASISQTITLNPSTNYTLITANYAASLTPILLSDLTTAPGSGDFNLRIVNAAVEAGSVDVYIQTPGSTNPANGGISPTIGGLAFTSSSSYQSLAAGSWNVIVTPAGYPVVNYVNTGGLTFTAGQNRTLVIVPTGTGGITTQMLNDLN